MLEFGDVQQDVRQQTRSDSPNFSRNSAVCTGSLCLSNKQKDALALGLTAVDLSIVLELQSDCNVPSIVFLKRCP
jgi:hypothetical protein